MSIAPDTTTPAGTDHAARRVPPARSTAPVLDPPRPRRPRRDRWPWWLVAAGTTGLVANFTSLGATTAQDDPDPAIVVENLSRTQYHVSFVFGLACAGCLVLAVTAVRDWVGERGRGRLGAAAIPNALTVTATLAVVAACMAGSLALYLPGGLDDGTMWTGGLLASYYYLDFGALIGWWGAVLAAICAVPLSLGDDRTLPRWFGVITLPLIAVPVVAAAATGLPGLPGLTMPIWLALFGVAIGRHSGDEERGHAVER